MPISEFTGKEVPNTSEEWRHECECRWLLDGFKDRDARNLYLDGGMVDSKFKRGVKQARGEAAVNVLRADTLRLFQLRQERKKVPNPAAESGNNQESK